MESTSDLMAIVCEEISPIYKQFCIHAEHEKIQDEVIRLGTVPIEDKKRIFRNVYRALTIYTFEELHTHYKAKDTEWDDWCADVFIFYTVRYSIFTKRIPVRRMDPEELAEFHTQTDVKKKPIP